MKIGCVDKQKCANKSGFYHLKFLTSRLKGRIFGTTKLEFNKEKEDSAGLDLLKPVFYAPYCTAALLRENQ